MGTWGYAGFQNLSLSPAAGVINYGQGLFEGMKARRAEDGRVLLFRPELNARRAQDGCKRLGMPVVPEEMFLDAVHLVVQENPQMATPYWSRRIIHQTSSLWKWLNP